jgi:hypothetical protein
LPKPRASDNERRRPLLCADSTHDASGSLATELVAGCGSSGGTFRDGAEGGKRPVTTPVSGRCSSVRSLQGRVDPGAACPAKHPDGGSGCNGWLHMRQIESHADPRVPESPATTGVLPHLRRAAPLVAPGASREPGRCKHQSSSRAARGRAVGIGHKQRRRSSVAGGLATIAFVLRPPRASRSQWRRCVGSGATPFDGATWCADDRFRDSASPTLAIATPRFA